MTLRTKVLHVTEDMGMGGQEKVILTLASGLSPRFAVEVWCLVKGGVLADAVRESGIPVRVLGLPGYRNPLNILRLARCIRRSGADIVHTHGDFAGTFARVSALLAGKLTLVAHAHTCDPVTTPRHVRIQQLLGLFTRRIICVSQAVREHVTDVFGIPVEKTRVIHNGVAPAARPEQGRPEHGNPRRECLAVSVGSLVEHKGHRHLIDAVAQAVAFRPDLNLLLVGDGPLRGTLERQASELGISANVRFAGCVSDVHPMLKQAAMFVLPTIEREGLGLAILEALQHGLPVVATRVGGIPEVIDHDRSGVLVPPRDAAALAGAMLKLASDQPLRERLGAAGRTRYDRWFRAERMVAQVESLYASMCGVRSLAF